ncbi:hypothetical protein BN2475_300004 [Paraburkholderia ribeironis]|uniref:Uncharacterized protein n=1 Tax=Paraburkholderia ribeironis TaxID=1247936 RepID=A0A1N7S226_9BURK|nr:hypothetical protein BN2475_300004 [Paraburkholderia ribeironis]
MPAVAGVVPAKPLYVCEPTVADVTLTPATAAEEPEPSATLFATIAVEFAPSAIAFVFDAIALTPCAIDWLPLADVVPIPIAIESDPVAVPLGKLELATK